MDGHGLQRYLPGWSWSGSGMLRLGTLLKFIPHPLIVGLLPVLWRFSPRKYRMLWDFGTGRRAEFIGKWVLISGIDTVNRYAVGIGDRDRVDRVYAEDYKQGAGFVVAILWRLLWHSLPEAVRWRRSSSSGRLNVIWPGVPVNRVGTVVSLLAASHDTIAILGAIESLLSA